MGIAKINGIPWASIAKVSGKLKSNIAKLCGVSISNVFNPSSVFQVLIPDKAMVPMHWCNVLFTNNRLYWSEVISNNTAKLWIWDMSNLTNPQLLNTWDTGIMMPDGYGLFLHRVINNVLYCGYSYWAGYGRNDGKIYGFDVSNPNSPTILFSASPNNGNVLFHNKGIPFVNNRYLLIHSAASPYPYNYSLMYVFDTQTLTFVNNFQLPYTIDTGIGGKYWKNNVLFVATYQSNSLITYDMSNIPTSMPQIGNTLSLSGAEGIIYNGTSDYMYLFGSSNLYVVNISNLNNKTLVRTIGGFSPEIYSGYIFDNKLVLEQCTGYWKIYDISDPTNPILQQNFAVSTSDGKTSNITYGMFYQNNLPDFAQFLRGKNFYFASWGNGYYYVKIYD